MRSCAGARPRGRCRAERPRRTSCVDVPLGSRSVGRAVVGAESRCGGAVRRDQRQQRRRGCGRWSPRGSARTCPRASFSCASSSVDASWSEPMPAARYALRRRPETPGAWPSIVVAAGTRRASRPRRVAGDDAGEIHELGEAERTPTPQERSRSAGESARRDARRGSRARKTGTWRRVERQLLGTRRAASGCRRCPARWRSRAGRRSPPSCRAGAPRGQTAAGVSLED